MENGPYKILTEGKINSKRKDLILSCALHPGPLEEPPPREIKRASTKEPLPFLAFLVEYLELVLK
jgi:hypothetical protein